MFAADPRLERSNLHDSCVEELGARAMDGTPMEPHTSHTSMSDPERADSSYRVERAVEVARQERDAALALVDAVLESVPAAFALFDRDFRLTRLNAAMEAFLRTP